MHTPPGSHARRALLSLILLLPFAVPATALELPEDRWVAQEWDGFGIVASVNGSVTHGDRFFVRPRPTDCDHGFLFFWVHTLANHPEVEDLEGRTIPILIDQDPLHVRMGYPVEFLFGHLVSMHMGLFPLDRLARFLAGRENLTIRLVDGPDYRASDYFHQRRNVWSLAGFAEALAAARGLCERRRDKRKEREGPEGDRPDAVGDGGNGKRPERLASAAQRERRLNPLQFAGP